MANSKNGKSTKDDKVFDVAKPGKTAASSTSKPVIIGHKSMLKDPMVKDEIAITGVETTSVQSEADEKPSGEPAPKPSDSEPGTAPTVSGVKINPPSIAKNADKETEKSTKTTKKSVKLQIQTDVESSDKQKDESADDKTDESEVKDSLPDDAGDDSEETDKESEPTDESKDDSSSEAGSDAAAASAIANQAEANKKAEVESKEAAAKTAAMEKLVASKKYYVPIGQKTRKKRSLQNILLGIILILIFGALLVNVLLDAGIIEINNFEAPIKIINP